MKLYIINSDITFNQAEYLLNHLTSYNDEVCDIVEIINSNVQNIKSGYFDKLTIGKLKHQLTYVNIQYSIEDDEDEVIYYLIQTQQIKVKDIFKICKFNAYKCLQVLFDQCINVNIPNNYGSTPLHWACLFNSVECVKLLLDNGAKKDIQDNRGWTPLHTACYNNSFESVKLLLLNGANINMPNNYSETPLQLALQHNYKDCIKLLQDL